MFNFLFLVYYKERGIEVFIGNVSNDLYFGENWLYIIEKY